MFLELYLVSKKFSQKYSHFLSALFRLLGYLLKPWGCQQFDTATCTLNVFCKGWKWRKVPWEIKNRLLLGFGVGSPPSDNVHTTTVLNSSPFAHVIQNSGPWNGLAIDWFVYKLELAIFTICAMATNCHARFKCSARWVTCRQFNTVCCGRKKHANIVCMRNVTLLFHHFQCFAQVKALNCRVIIENCIS